MGKAGGDDGNGRAALGQRTGGKAGEGRACRVGGQRVENKFEALAGKANQAGL